MGVRGAVLAVVIGLIIGFFKTTRNDYKSNGMVQQIFQPIRETFDEILSREKEGLAFAAYKNDQLIVDLWGGYAERAAYREWDRDTMTVAFSSTKAVGALIIAILVSRGQLQYEDKIVKYWPEFGAQNKENITVQWILEHKTKPKWPAGTARGYHALTFGWLLDQIVRHCDPLKRGIAQFYRDEIQKYMDDKDFYLGLPRDEHYRVARIIQPTMFEFIYGMASTTKYYLLIWKCFLSFFRCEIYATSKYPSWLSFLDDEMPYNNPAVREVENVAVLGIGTARGLANVVSTIWKKNLISEEIWKRLSMPVEYANDRITYFKSYHGHGFLYKPHPIRPNKYVMFHPGHGSQNLIIDPFSKTVVVMMRNAIVWKRSALDESFALANNIIQITNMNS
ncbi:beta-lactamase, variant [Loa loa]|uniref:Beta-lactamase, variant n=1 Tax=Loa loa TaxID=7209 RepID=A0A1S0UDW4_LOALO|nr:beta-lactamase, variant [Loa loa]EJD73779.1 beta-lactamase, variant [Loa loa]